MSHIFSSWPDVAEIDLNQFGFGSSPVDDFLLHQTYRALISRISEFGTISGNAGAIWRDVLSGHGKLIADLRDSGFEAFSSLAGRLFETALTHGFAQGHLVAQDLRARPEARLHVATIILDRLYRLAEAVGAASVCNPEQHQHEIVAQGLDALLDRIQQNVGFDLSPPRVNGRQFGVRIGGGILSERHFDAIYSAWRVKRLLEERCGEMTPVCEIGGGAGFLAHYARRAGIRDYCIIDFPTVGFVQFIILASEFGADCVYLGPSLRDISLISTDHFEQDVDFSRFGIVVNTDSLPEMPGPIARGYLKAAARSGALLSINQESAAEHMGFRQSLVRDLCGGLLKPVYRFPSWLRMGWVEELFEPTEPRP